MILLNFSFCRIIFFNLLITLTFNGYAQKIITSDIITVKVYVVGKGSPAAGKSDGQDYFSFSTISNNQDTMISFWIMEQSWPKDNWVVDNDSVFFKFLGNDINSPVLINLLPNKSIDFYFILRSKINTNIKNKFRVGFYFTDPEIGFSHSNNKEIIKKAKKYWSNELQLENNVIGYKIE